MAHTPKVRSTRTRLSARKRIAFTLAALALPIAAIAITEFCLRWAGYGGYGTTFHIAATAPDGSHLIAADNERTRTFFFNNRDQPGALNITHFFDPKPADELRVIVVGESAIKGFPVPPSVTTASFLQQMLADALPDRTVNVINLGVTAVASYPILELGTEALGYDPDVMVVQVGNNEFFGAYGVASLNRAGNSPGAIAFQRWGNSLALVQWAKGATASMRAAPPKSSNTSTLMERMMGSSFTAPGDPIREAAAHNLRTHLRTLIRRCEQRGVPVVVCLSGVNERGMAPLGQSRTDGLSIEDKARFDALMAIDPQEAAGALDDLRWAVDAAPDHARAHWLVATALHQRGEYAEAQAEFQRSVDLDPMPWRATSAILDAARAAIAETGAKEADGIGALRAASEGGSIGWELMMDHVHMSVEGQEVVARAIFDAMTQIPSVGLPPDASARLAEREVYEYRLGLSMFDIHGATYRMHRLLKVPFFEETNPWAARIMAERMREMEALMTESERAAVTAWQDPKASLEYGVPASAFVGQVCMMEQRYDQGERVYRAASMIISPYSYLSLEFTYRWLGCRMRTHGGLDAEDQRIAQQALDRGMLMLSAADTSAAPIHRYVGSLKTLLGDYAGAIPHLQKGRHGFRDMELVQVDAQIVDCLVKMGRMGDAEQVIEYGITNAGPFAPMYQQMRQQARDAATPPG